MTRTKSRRKTVRAVEEFDYSGLSPEFSKLSRPAQRALINNGIRTPKQLSRISTAELFGFHGIGPSSIPILLAVLKKNRLAFRD